MSMPSSGSERPFQDGGLFEYRVRLRVIEVLARAAKGAEPQAAPKELCRACIRLPPVSGSSVSISGGRRATRVRATRPPRGWPRPSTHWAPAHCADEHPQAEAGLCGRLNRRRPRPTASGSFRGSGAR